MNVPGVLSETDVGVIRNAGVVVKLDVFKNGPETDCVEDFWLLFGAQIHALGIAPTWMKIK